MTALTTGRRAGRNGFPADAPELGRLVEVLQGDGVAGAVILGGPGTGKSSLVQAALEAAGRSGEVLSVQCSQSLRDAPYGALTPLLTSLDELATPVDVLRSLQTLGPDPVIVVTDAQYLDAASAFVLAQLVQNRAARLLAVGTGALVRDSGIAALADTGVLTTIQMDPADPERVRRQCEQVLGGPLTEGTVRTIHGMTGGNPRLVNAFVASAREQGALVRAPDGPALPGQAAPWILLRPAPDPDTRLIDTVESMHTALTPGEREALDLVALAGRTSRALLRGVTGEHAHDLMDAGFLRQVGPDAVEPAAALHAEVLRASIPPGRSLDLFAKWQSSGGETTGPRTARGVLWALECGQRVPTEEIIGAGYEALGARDWPTARALAPFLVDVDHPRAALFVAELMLGGGRTWAARTELEDLTARSSDPDFRLEVYSVLAMDRVRSGEAPHAWAALPSLVSRVRAQSPTPPVLSEALATVADLLMEEPGNGSRDELLQQTRRVIEDRGTEKGTRAIMLVLEADLLGMAGRSTEAIAAARKASELAEGSPSFSARFGVYTLANLVMTYITAGHLDEADRLLREQATLAPRLWHQRSGTVQVLRALLDSARGGPVHALGHLEDAVVELRHHDPVRLHQLAEAMLARHWASLSPAAAPEHSAEERAQQPQQGPRGRWLLSLALFSIAEDRTLEYSEGHQPLWRRIVEDPRLDEDPVVRQEILCTVLALRDPLIDDGGLMARLHRLCAVLEGPRSEALTRVLDPGLGDDPRGLAHVAEEMATAGEDLPAALAWARLVLLHHGAGDLRRRGEALRRLKRLQVTSGLVLPPYVAGALALGELTAREQEIVDLAAQGMSNAEVADRLFVSQRTVEGHLYRVFTKLGITDRSELRDLQF